MRENNSLSKFERHVENYNDFISWCRWYPDLFLDLIKPEMGGITLHADQRLFMRSIMRFQAVYGVLPRGYGKCVTRDSIVFSNTGIKEIGEYFTCEENGLEDWFPSNGDSTINRYGKSEKISSFYYSGLKPTKKIITEYDYTIEGTLNHPILRMNEDGNIDWCNLEDLKIGDFVCINRKNDNWGNNIDIDKSKELDEWV
jgi:ribonucleoside-diphosphate reductase alpha chain